MASKMTSVDERRMRRMGFETRPTPTPTLREVGAAAAGAWFYWAMVALGFVLIYVSFFMEAGPIDEFLFGILTIAAVAAGARRTYAGAQSRARGRVDVPSE